MKKHESVITTMTNLRVGTAETEMTTDNTSPAFYSLWSREQLVNELVRINKLLNEIEDDISSLEKTL